MRKKTELIVSAAMLSALLGTASAGEPTVLTDAQMDGVTAGSTSWVVTFPTKKGFTKGFNIQELTPMPSASTTSTGVLMHDTVINEFVLDEITPAAARPNDPLDLI